VPSVPKAPATEPLVSRQRIRQNAHDRVAPCTCGRGTEIVVPRQRCPCCQGPAARCSRRGVVVTVACAVCHHAPDYVPGGVGQAYARRAQACEPVAPERTFDLFGCPFRDFVTIWSMPQRGCGMNFFCLHPFRRCAREYQTNATSEPGTERTYSSGMGRRRVKAWIADNQRRCCFLFRFQAPLAAAAEQGDARGFAADDKDPGCCWIIVIKLLAWRRSPMCSQRPQRGGSDKFRAMVVDVVCAIARKLAGTGYAVRCYAGRGEPKRNRGAFFADHVHLVADFVDRLFQLIESNWHLFFIGYFSRVHRVRVTRTRAFAQCEPRLNGLSQRVLDPSDGHSSLRIDRTATEQLGADPI